MRPILVLHKKMGLPSIDNKARASIRQFWVNCNYFFTHFPAFEDFLFPHDGLADKAQSENRPMAPCFRRKIPKSYETVV